MAYLYEQKIARKDRGNICFHCGRIWHYKRNQKKQDDNSTTTVVSNQDVAVLTSSDAECLHVAGHDTEWVIDSGASYHVTP